MPDYLAAGASLVLILTGLVAWFRWVRPKWRGFKKDATAARDSILGREAQHDSITGKEILPALPGIGQRVASLEENTAVMAAAVRSLADTHKRLDTHDERISRLERGASERELARTESIELLRTIDNAIRSDPKKE